MFETKHIQKYLEEIKPMSFTETVEKIVNYPDKLRLDVNLLQVVFAKLFMPSTVKSDNICWETLDNKIEILSCFKDNFDILYNYLKIVFRDGYYSFAEDLYNTRIVYIFVYLKKQKEINNLYNILIEHCESYTPIFYDFWGNGFHFSPEQPWSFFTQGWDMPEDELYNTNLFDENGEIIK